MPGGDNETLALVELEAGVDQHFPFVGSPSQDDPDSGLIPKHGG